MKKETVELYTCEVCGKQSKDEEEIVACERSHFTSIQDKQIYNEVQQLKSFMDVIFDYPSKYTMDDLNKKTSNSLDKIMSALKERNNISQKPNTKALTRTIIDMAYLYKSRSYNKLILEKHVPFSISCTCYYVLTPNNECIGLVYSINDLITILNDLSNDAYS